MARNWTAALAIVVVDMKHEKQIFNLFSVKSLELYFKLR